MTLERHIDVPAPPTAATWVHDARIKAAVVAAPALGFTFTPAGLSAVSVPVQLWRAEEDEILPHPNYAQAVYEALPRKPDYHVVPNAGHFAFVPPYSEALAQRALARLRLIDPAARVSNLRDLKTSPGLKTACARRGCRSDRVIFVDDR